MFGSLPRGLSLGRPALSPRWGGVVRTLASSTAGIVFAAALVGVAGLGLAPEPPVTAVVEGAGEVAPPVSDRAAVAVQPVVTAPVGPFVTAAPVAEAVASAPPPTAAPATDPPAPAPAAPAPAAAAPAIEAAPYRSGGRSYAALTVEPGAELASPLAGRAEVRTYQLINGEIRTGANVAGLAYYPYVIVRGVDRVLTLRPGALGVDSELLVRDGTAVAPGTPLVRVIGAGASSWRVFYDRTLEAQVVVSLTTAGGADLDAVPLFRQ